MKEENTRLEYGITPFNVFYTRDPQNPSVEILHIGVSNLHDEEVDIKQFQVSLPISEDPEDRDAITADADSITPVSLQPDTWSFSKIEPGLYQAKPIAPVKGVPAGKSITFQLKNIIVNDVAGTVAILIVEEDEDGSTPSVTKQVVKIASDLDIEKFTAVPTDITSGDPSLLSWTTKGAAKVTLAPGDHPGIKVNDSITVYPELTTTFTLTASGEGPNISKQVTIQIPPPKIVSFVADPTEVNAGDEVTLSWEVQYASDISIVPGDFKNLPLKGDVKVQVQTTTTFILYAANQGHQSANSPVAVTVKPVKIKLFLADPGYGVQVGDAVELRWEIDSATSAYIQPGSINIPTQNLKKGSWWVEPTAATSYSLFAQGSNLDVSIVNVLPMPSGWHQFSSAAPFNAATAGVLTHQVKLWLFTQTGRTYNSWDGQNWTTVAGVAGWQPRSGCAVCVFNGKMWLVGGEKQGNYLNDVWNSVDGANWAQVTPAAQWAARKDLGCYTIPGSTKIFIVGGLDKSGSFFNDVWSSSDGVNWAQESGAAFAGGGRSGMAIAGPGLVISALGGSTANGNVNETYNTTDGKTWNKMATPNWAARTGAKASVNITGLYFGYGTNNNTNFYDLFNQSGTGCWLSPVTPPAANVSPFLLEYQEALWLIGGSQGGAFNQNVWSYNPEKTIDGPANKKIIWDFDMGTESYLVSFVLKCSYIPVNSKVGFYASKTGTDPLICLIDIKVTEPVSFVVGIDVYVPAGFRCDIVGYANAPQGVTFSDNSSIALAAYISVQP